MAEERTDKNMNRRGFLATVLRGLGAVGAAGLFGWLAGRGEAEEYVWQIDPDKCTQCGNCATACVLTPSAAKCVHEFAICGYCDLCFGYYVDQRADDVEAAENRRCPNDAIRRSFVEEPYYQYVIEEDKCIGCAVCVKGCQTFGNGALIMQVRHDRCINCNECSIAAVCPSDAFVRVPADDPYLLRTKDS